MKLPIKTIVATHLIATACYAQQIPPVPTDTPDVTPAQWFKGDLHYDKHLAQATVNLVPSINQMKATILTMQLNLENVANKVTELTQSVVALTEAMKSVETTDLVTLEVNTLRIARATEALSYYLRVSATGLTINTPINVNQAGFKDLVQVPGMSYSRAFQVLSNRPFASLDELSTVPGFSQSVVDDMAGWVEVGE